MAVQIIQDFIPKGRKNRPGYKMTPRYITIHDTANPGAGANAKAHAAYLKGAAAAAIPASWHFTVDDKVIYQHLPLTENGWHCGDGTNGTGNRQSIGVEICENSDGNRAKAEANAVWLTAKLLKDYGLKIAAVKQHYDWSGKNCPNVLRGRKNGWSGF
ncbi:MAG TPA: N-acetylmuramoyl-L-alanine amidase, partial [Bacillota bacterium]|nr:N-acetylmuramoyl-L-alanine amidase [Bacillota bacterium]